MKNLLTIILFSLSSLGLQAQSDLFEIGFFLGGSSMGGDLVESNFGSVNEINGAYGLMIRRYFNTNMAVRVSALTTKLTSQDRHFDRYGGQVFISETPVIEFSADFEYDILGHQRNWQGNGGKVSPYVFIGVGAALTDPMLTYDFESEDIMLDETADVSKTRFIVPFGVGGRYNFSSKGTIALEFSARPTFSDYLDGVSLAGNPGKNDWYGFGSVQFWFKLSGKKY